MLTLQLPEEIESQLEELATASGRTSASFAEEAIIEFLGDKIDVAIAEYRLRELREGRSTTISLDDFVRKYGLEVPREVESRLQDAAAASGKSMDALVLDAIIEYLENVEDIAAAEHALERIRAGEPTIPLDELMDKYGLAR